MTSAVSDLALAFLSGHPAAAGAVLELVEPEEAAQALLPLELARGSEVLMRMSVDGAARTLRCMAVACSVAGKKRRSTPISSMR